MKENKAGTVMGIEGKSDKTDKRKRAVFIFVRQQ